MNLYSPRRCVLSPPLLSPPFAVTMMRCFQRTRTYNAALTDLEDLDFIKEKSRLDVLRGDVRRRIFPSFSLVPSGFWLHCLFVGILFLILCPWSTTSSLLLRLLRSKHSVGHSATIEPPALISNPPPHEQVFNNIRLHSTFPIVNF